MSRGALRAALVREREEGVGSSGLESVGNMRKQLIHRGLLSLAVVTAGLLAWSSQASAGIVWVDPNNYNLGYPITPPFVTLQALQGATAQTPPFTPTVFAMADDKGHYPSSLHFFGWQTKSNNVIYDKPAWRQKWVVLRAEFDSPVSFVSMDFYRNDFSGGPLDDELGFLTAYNSSNVPIATVPVGIAFNQQLFTATISLANPDIKYVMASGVYNPSSSIDDDLLLTRLGYSVEVVPEPLSLVALASGGGVMAVWMGLRRRSARRKESQAA